MKNHLVEILPAFGGIITTIVADMSHSPYVTLVSGIFTTIYTAVKTVEIIQGMMRRRRERRFRQRQFRERNHRRDSGHWGT